MRLKSSVSRRDLLWAGAICLSPRVPRLLAQDKASPPPSFSSDVKVVNVYATVRNKEGKLVTDLTKDDFQIEEDHRPQSIKYFSRQADQPLTIGLLVDTSGSERRMIGTEQAASESFLDEVLRVNKDRAFVLHFDREVELLQDLTSSREKLDKALGTLTAQSNKDRSDPDGNRRDDTSSGGQRNGERARGGTALYDSVYLAANDVLAKEQGRKAILLLTDGEDRHSKISLAEAIASAQRADTLAYSVYIADESHGGFGNESGHHRGGMGGGGGGWGMPGGGGGPMGGGGWPGSGGGGGGGRGRGGSYESHVDGKKILQQISRETGGAFAEVTKKKTLSDIYVQMREELSNQYSLGYTPDGTPTPGYHQIAVTVKRKGLTVEARQGYYAKS